MEEVRATGRSWPYRRRVVTEPGVDTSRSDRLERQRAFHDDRFAHEPRQAAGKYYAVDTGRARYVEFVRSSAEPGRAVFECGCGTGSEAFALAAAGAETVGIDISGVGVSEATDRARREVVDARFVQIEPRPWPAPTGRSTWCAVRRSCTNSTSSGRWPRSGGC